MAKREIDTFCQKMDELIPRLGRKFLRRSPVVLAHDKISVPQIFILELLLQKESCNMSGLAEDLSVSTSAATGLVNRMLKAGLVERMREGKDRRIVKVKATKKGNTIIKRLIDQRRQAVMEIFTKISRQDREKYIDILEKICRILEEKSNG